MLKQQEQQQQRHHIVVHGVKTLVPMHPSQLVIRPVSKLDSILGNFYLRKILYFTPPQLSWVDEQEALNYSLAQVLDLLPFLAGRLRVLDNGNLGIKCNDSGVRLFEATCDSSLREWLEADKDGSKRQQLAPEVRISDYSVSPLLAIQYTGFHGGGIAIGLSWCHILADFMSIDILVKLWGEAHRNQGKFMSRPKLSIDVKSADIQLPQPFAADDSYTSKAIKPAELETRVFHFSSKLVDKVMYEAGAGETEALCAAVWRAVVEARGGGAAADSRLCLWTNTNLDKHRGYFGNAATAFKLVDASSSTLWSQGSVSDAVHSIQNGTKANGSYKTFFANNVLFCNWAGNVPAYDRTEFGFGVPFLVEFLASPVFGDGMVTIGPGREGGRSKSVCVCLRSDAMKRLLQDSLYFKPVNGSSIESGLESM